MTAQRVEELIRNVNRFAATEVVQHQRVDRSGRPKTLTFDYLVSIAPIAGGRLKFQEYRDRPQLLRHPVASDSVPPEPPV